jgi:hypothetical protein
MNNFLIGFISLSNIIAVLVIITRLSIFVLREKKFKGSWRYVFLYDSVNETPEVLSSLAFGVAVFLDILVIIYISSEFIGSLVN